MKGLLYKDFSLLLSVYKLYMVLLAAFAAVQFFVPSISFLSIYVVILVAEFAPSTMSYDEKDGWDMYANVLPVSRAEYVSSKYLLGLILSFAVIIVNSAACIVNYGFSDTALTIILFNVTVALVNHAIPFPIIFRFGYAKGRISVVFVAAALAGASLFVGNVDISEKLTDYTLVAVFAATAAAAVIFTVSWLISIRVYKKRQF